MIIIIVELDHLRDKFLIRFDYHDGHHHFHNYGDNLDHGLLHGDNFDHGLLRHDTITSQISCSFLGSIGRSFFPLVASQNRPSMNS